MATTSESKIFEGRKSKVIIGMIIVIIGIQFYIPDKNNQKSFPFNDFLVHQKAPESVAMIIRKSCYNCHSNSTEYYWYDNIAPASWYVDYHIREAKEHLNFSEWTTSDYRDKRSHLSNMATSINENKMPLPSYVFVHREAILSPDDKQEILNWLFTIEINQP